MKKHSLTHHQIHILCAVIAAFEQIRDTSYIIATQGPGCTTMRRGHDIGETASLSIGRLDWLLDDLGLVRVDAHSDVVAAELPGEDTVSGPGFGEGCIEFADEKPASFQGAAKGKKVVTGKPKR